MKNPGESLLEILVSTVIIVVILTTVFALIQQGMSVSVSSENRLQAINIAREGIEAVRNIRDTNWLKYSGNRREKWLCLDKLSGWTPSHTIATDCIESGGLKIGSGFYIVDFSQDFGRYFLEEIMLSSPLDLDDSNEDFSSFQLFRNNSSNRLTHYSNSGNNSATPFYRQLKLTPKSENVCPPDDCPEEKLEVISRVQWKEGKNLRETVLETHLYDFYNRHAY
jgi:type II secretory pathway pseudopilin PulG